MNLKSFTSITLSAGLALAGIAGLATPAGAAQTSATFTLTAGTLALSVPGSANLGSTGTGSTTTSAQLGAVSVSDARGTLGGSWTAAVSSSDFVTGGATANETITNDDVDYWSGPGTATSGVGTFTPGQLTSVLAVDLSTARTAFGAAAVVGNNTATWNPTVVVNLRSSAVAGTYAGTVTHSIA